MQSQDTLTLTWDDFRYVLAVQRHGTFADAAHALGVAPSTVGRRIRALEEVLGSALFHRLATGPQPTDAGRRVLEAAERLEALIQEARLEASGADVRAEGTVRLTSAEPFLVWLAPRLATFRRLHPGVELELLADTRQLDLAREAELAIRMVQPSGNSLVARKLGSLVFRLYASEAYLERSSPLRSVEDLGRHALLGLDASFEGLMEMRWFKRQGLTRFVLRANSTAVLAAAASAGQGVVMLAAAQASLYPALRPVLPQVTLPTLDIWLVMHERFRQVARVRLLADFITAEFERQQALLAGAR